jgi:predicted NUDIX family NTP pyrophosphohydrolase
MEMVKRSAGILLYRRIRGSLQVLLIHPGGPYWQLKDAGAWSIPKGLIGVGEEPLLAAKREFREETGTTPPRRLRRSWRVSSAQRQAPDRVGAPRRFRS